MNMMAPLVVVVVVVTGAKQSQFLVLRLRLEFDKLVYLQVYPITFGCQSSPSYSIKFLPNFLKQQMRMWMELSLLVSQQTWRLTRTNLIFWFGWQCRMVRVVWVYQ